MGTHPKGIRPWKGGWQAYVRTRSGLVSKSFPIDTPIDTMKTWRKVQQLAAPIAKPAGPTFEKDVAAYLARVTAMPTYGQRKQHLELWLKALGRDRLRSTIVTAEIDHVMQRWLTAKLEPDTVRKRRTSLLALFHKLDGKAAVNPVRDSRPPPAALPQVRGLDERSLIKVLASLPPSKTAARLRVLAWTGLPPGMLMALTPADVDLDRAEVRVRPRRKGAGSPARALPLTPQAVDAFRQMIALGAFGDFAGGSAGRSLQRACKRSSIAPIRLYDLRHTFGALLYLKTKDLPTVGRFLLHASLTSTARYAMAAAGDVDRAAAKLLGESLTEVVP